MSATSRRFDLSAARGWLACVALGAVVVAAASCSAKKHPLVGNLPPETQLFVSGPVDTVNHRIHLYWFGSDVDGDVVGYRMRLVYPPPASQDPPWDTLYCGRGATCTDSLFTVFTGDSALVNPRFEIAAIDNDGALDESPATQSFYLTNVEPRVTITGPLGAADSTYASLTVSWDVNDPDGGGPGLHYRVWLDGNEANYDSTAERTFTLPSARFIKNGTYTSGPRTVYVQAVDDGGRSGPPATMTWYVRAPGTTLTSALKGKVLIIDEVPHLGQANFTFDAFYQTAATESLAAGTFSVLRPEYNPNIFRSARDFAQTLRQFEAVVWYRGLETTVSPLLTTYQDSLEAYLDQGGSLYLDGLYLVQGQHTPGALREDFVTRRLNAARMVHVYNPSVLDSTAGWSTTTSSLFRSTAYANAYRSTTSSPNAANSTGGIRAFVLNDTSQAALWAIAPTLSPTNDEDIPVGVTLAQPGGGHLVFIGMPLRIGTPAPAGVMLRRMLYGYNGIPGVISRASLLLGRRGLLGRR